MKTIVLLLTSLIYITSSFCQEKIEMTEGIKKTVKEWDAIIEKPLSQIPDYIKLSAYCNDFMMDSCILLYDRLPVEELSDDQHIFIINKIAFAFYRLGAGSSINFDYSLNWLQKAISIIGSGKTKFKKVEADTYRYSGLNYYYKVIGDSGLNHYSISTVESSLSYLKSAREIYSKVIVPADNIHVKINLSIGDVYHWINFDYQNANDFYNEALTQINPEAIENDNDLFYYIYTLYDLASVKRNMYDWKTGIGYIDEALNRIPEFESGYYIETWYNRCRTAKGNILREDSCFAEALENYRLVEEEQPENTLLLNNMATCYEEMNDTLMAEEYCRKALEIGLNQNPVDPEQVSTSYHILGDIYLKKGKFQKAEKHYNECLDIRIKQYGDTKHSMKMIIYQDLGILNLRRNRIDEALKNTQNAIIQQAIGFEESDPLINPYTGQIVNPAFLLETLQIKADALRIKHHQTSDLKYLVASLNCIALGDSLNKIIYQSFLIEDSRLFLKSRVAKLYNIGVANAYQLYSQTHGEEYLKQAFGFFEKDKYQNLLDKLNSKAAFEESMVPEETINELQSLQMRHQYFIRERLHDPSNQDFIDSVSNLTIRMNYLKNMLENNYPDYFEIKLGQNDMDIDDLQDSLRGKGTMIIQYYWTSDNIYAISSDGEEKIFNSIPVDSTFLASLAHFRQSLVRPDYGGTDYSEFVDNSYYLFKNLVEPFFSGAKKNNVQNIIFIPDGDLNEINFEALIMEVPDNDLPDYGRLSYLIKDYKISYAFSSGILFFDLDWEPISNKSKVLGFAYGSGNKITKFNDISGSRNELKTIANKYAGKYYYDDNATKTNFENLASKFDILHLALHGMADTDNNDSTLLVFRPASKQKDNEYLYSHDLYLLGLRAGLVVLSSCNTGVGMTYEGEGVYSMARAFFYSGCPSLISTLWPVGDDVSAMIMKNFYRSLSSEGSASMALRSAKLNYINNVSLQQEAHPSYWASYIAQGNEVEIDLKKNYQRSGIPLGLILLLLFVALFLLLGDKRKHNRS